jgi:PAS domain S-box-containing protein
MRDGAEAQSSSKDVFIHVTSLFDDRKTFEALETLVFPSLLNERRDGPPIRVWVPGCSTGDEVYSLVIALLEFSTEIAGKDVPVLAFGTDISRCAVDRARAGRYAENLAQQVSPERLKRFFVKIDGGYQIAQHVRERCVFATQDVLKDPPFSNLDLISCGSLAKSLDPALQRPLLALFHYALRSSGVLLLGRVEGLRDSPGFAVADAENRILFRTPTPAYPAFCARDRAPWLLVDHTADNDALLALSEETSSANEELVSNNEELQLAKEELRATNAALRRINDQVAARNAATTRLADDLANILANVAIPIVIVDRDARIRSFTPAASALLSLIPSDVGRPIHDIKPKIRPDELSEMIADVLSRLSPVERTMQADDHRWYHVTVRPYATADHRVDGAVLSVFDVDPLKRTEQLLTEARDYAEGIVETVREGLVVLDGGLRVQSANRAFYETFKLSRAAVEGRLLFDLDGGAWDLPELRVLLRKGEFAELRIEREFPRTGDRVLLLTGRRIAGTPRLLVAIHDVTATERADAVLEAQPGVLEYQEKLQHVAFDATVAEERERRRIAVNLHDGIGQALAAAHLKLMAAHEKTRGEARNVVHQALDLVGQAIADTRTLMFDLSPPVLYDLGFWEALDWLAEDVAAQHEVKVEVIDDETRPLFNETTVAILFRSIRELLANAVKHSRTKRVRVHMRTDADRYAIEVIDGGRGFDCAAVTASRTGGFGLFSVREQMSRLRGTLDIAASPGSGTRVTLRVPIPAATTPPQEGGP